MNIMSKIANVENVNGKLVVNAKAEVFIIPNTPSKINWASCLGERLADAMNEISKLNGYEFSPDEKLVQLWWTSEDLGSENLGDHGIRVQLNEDHLKIAASCTYNPFGYLPIGMVKDWHDGEEIEIIIPVKTDDNCFVFKNGRFDRNATKADEMEIEFHLKVTPSQLKYRYRRFGTFEECLHSIC